ncbi:MAG: anthranilate phosphoribosyltransferase [Erysipelotrichaceae bacterium]|nr:anthranilate phosphoribosyltransferase [Erysipelotrichaceae bacterium]MDD3810040.1 anthranilate phosphoribosyltransferase [Erysipelotrichaceae bacterium]
MIKEAIIKLTNKENLTSEQAYQCMNEIMDGVASDVQKTAYLTALNMKGETIEEITGSARSMREHCRSFKSDGDLLEIVGTGGDGSNSFNISSTSALVLAAGGVKVAKHGNRAASSKSGAGDVYEQLGVKVDCEVERSQTSLEENGICFLYAPIYHPAMRFVGPVRQELKIRTIFNILGPLTNPAHAKTQIMGVYSEALVEPMAHVLANLGVKRGAVVFGQDGMDEISLSAKTTVMEIDHGKFTRYEINPADYGFKMAPKAAIVGGTPEDNARITLDVLSNKSGPHQDIVLLNAAMGFYLAGITPSYESGILYAREVIESKKPLEILDKFIATTNG